MPIYRPRPSPLHAAGAGPATALCGAWRWCARCTTTRWCWRVIAAVVGAGLAAGVGGEIARAARLSVPLALLVTLINPLVYAEGDTLLIRGGSVLGHRFDITLEALAAGGAGRPAGLAVFVMPFALFAACVDPDELLRSLRRVSYRSALTAALATRLVPVLARDATRMGDAARCRPDPPGRLAVARAALSGALERAVDVAAALEVRGYSARPPPGRARRSPSRHDVRVLAAAAIVAGRAVRGKLAGVGAVSHTRSSRSRSGLGELALCAILLTGGGDPVRRPFGAPGGGSCLRPVVSARGFGYRYPEADEPALRDVTLEPRRGHVHGSGGSLGLGQVHAAAGAVWPRAALPRRRRLGRAARGRAERARARARPSWPRSAAPCSRTPSRRW